MAETPTRERAALDRITGAFQRLQDKRATQQTDAQNETPTPTNPPKQPAR